MRGLGRAEVGTVTERFEALPALSRRYAELTGTPDLRLYAGAEAFFASFRRYIESEPRDLRRVIGLPPDPYDFLALPSGRDELRAAMAMGKSKPTEGDVLELAALFKLDAATVAQPVARLSGGEKACLALAKLVALQPAYDEVVLANPATSLDWSRRHLVEVALAAYLGEGKRATLLTVRGEWSEDGSEAERPAGATAVKGPDWTLDVSGSVVRLPASRFPVEAPGRTIRFRHSGPLRLSSPTLITGANGIGKSTLASLLCGMLPYEGREPTIRTRGHIGTARLMMQDCLTQMFSLTPGAHCEFFLRYARDLRKQALADLNGFDQRFDGYGFAEEETLGEVVRRTGDRNSLLHSKYALALERTATRPPLLILDEPSWGLSDRLSRSLFRELATLCASAGTALAVISHQSVWLEGLVRDHVELRASAEVVDLEKSRG